MIETIIEPRFSETDALTHIGNTVLPVWFESARTPIFKKLHPSFSAENWPFILAHIDVDYVNQIFVGDDVTIKTGVSKVGTKSFTVYHEAWQKNQLAASGSAVLVCFDFKTHSTVEMSADFRDKLEEFLIKE